MARSVRRNSSGQIQPLRAAERWLAWAKDLEQRAGGLVDFSVASHHSRDGACRARRARAPLGTAAFLALLAGGTGLGSRYQTDEDAGE